MGDTTLSAADDLLGDRAHGGSARNHGHTARADRGISAYRARHVASAARGGSLVHHLDDVDLGGARAAHPVRAAENAASIVQPPRRRRRITPTESGSNGE